MSDSGKREIDKYMKPDRSESPSKQIVDLQQEEERDAEFEKQLAIERQENARKKVAAARAVVADLRAKREAGDLDARNQFPACNERIFRYNYDNGNIKTSFVSGKKAYLSKYEHYP